jgi:hypothetical protein
VHGRLEAGVHDLAAVAPYNALRNTFLRDSLEVREGLRLIRWLVTVYNVLEKLLLLHTETKLITFEMRHIIRAAP